MILRVETVVYNPERKSNTYYTNVRKREQKGDFEDIFLKALQNISRNYRLYNK